MANKQFSKTIKINSNFDPSSILKGIKSIREELGQVATGKGRGLLGGIDNEIIKVEKAIGNMQGQIGKGFSSGKEVQQFNKQMDSILDSILGIKKELSNATNFSLEALTKESQKAFNEVSKQITDLQKKIRTSLASKAKPVFGSKDRTLGIIAGDEISGKMFDKRKKELQDELISQKKITQQLQQRLLLETKINSLESSVSRKGFSADEVGKKTNKSFSEIFTLDKAYTKSSDGREVRATKVNKAGATIYTNQFSDAAVGLINTLYRELLSEAAKAGQTIEKFKETFANELQARFAITADLNNADISEKIGRNLSSVKRAYNNPKYTESAELKRSRQSEVDLSNQIITIDELSAAAQEGAKSLDPLINKQIQLSGESKEVEGTLRQLNTDINNLNQPLRQEASAWEKINSSLKQTADSQERIDTGFDNIIRRTRMLFSAGTVFNFIRRQISATFQDVQTLDKSFAQIAMVTRYHVEELWGDYEQYAQMANRLGQTTNDVIQASVLFYQQGLETNEVLSLTEDTMKLATLAGVDFADATDLMTAALRGFKLEMSEGSHVTDVYSELAAHAAASVNEIANAMNKTAAIANSAGMSFENTAAFLTQMIESTQESAANIGTALKTVIARFTELKENVDASNSEFDDLDYNKVDKALKSVGISLKDDVGQFRDLDDVFMELAEKWQTLSRNEQRYIATTAAGSRQQSRFIALMDNYKRTVELVEIAQNSEGRSSQQFEKYAESLEYKLKRLRNTWEQFRISIASSSFFKGLVDNANKLLSVISKFDAVDWGKALLLFTTIGRKAASNFLKGWRETFSNLRSLEPQQLKIAKDSGRIEFFGSWLKTGVTKDQRQALKAREIAVNDSVTEEARKQSEKELENYSAKIQKQANAWSSSIGTSASMAFTTAFSAYMLANNPGEVFKTVMISGATTAASSVANIFSAQMASGEGIGTSFARGLQGGLVSIGISAAIAAAFAGIKALSNYFEKEGERIARSTSAFYDATRALEDLKKREEELNKTLSERKGLLEDSEKSYKELMKQGESLTELSKKTLLSTEEQEEYIKLSNEIVEQYPELLSYYDAEDNAIVNLGDAYEKLIEKKKENYLLDKQQVAESNYELALNQYSQAVESQEKAENLGTEKANALITLLSLGSFNDFDWLPQSPGRKADAKTAAAYFKEVLSENSLFNSTTEGKEYLEFLGDFLENEETAEEFFKTIEDYEKTHLTKDFTKEIKTAQNNLITKAQEYIVSQLEGTQYYQNITDVNAQRAMVRAILENANYNLDALKEEFESTVDTEGLNSTQIDKAFSDFMQEKLSSIDLDEDKLAGIFSEETANAWHRITLAVGKDATFDQYARAIFNSDLSDDEKRRWAQENIDTILTTNDQKKTLAGALGESLTDLNYGEGIILKQFAEGTFGRQIEDLGQVGYNKFVDGFEKASTGGTKARDQYVDSVKQLMTELGPENFKVLMSQDWDSYTKVNAEQFWHSMEEQFTGDYSTDFKTKYQKLIEDIFTNPYISGENLFEQITNNFDIIESNIQAYAKAIKSSAENGYIDASALKALYKAGAPIEKMVNDDSTINKEEADKWIKEQLLSEEQIVELLKDQETQHIKELEFLRDELRLQDEITQRLVYQTALTKTKNISQADALAKQYGGLNNDEFINEINKEIALRKEGLSDEAKLYKIAQGYVKASWGSYYDANQDYQDSLEKTTNKVKDNTKAITDAYDTILEKQQDLIDKQKKLNDVLYGTSTRKTSLDVLYNYKTALDSLNKEIERAKDVLDDLDGKSPAEYLNTIVSGTHGRAAYLTAQNEVNQKAINRTLSDLNQQLGSWLINNGYNINPTSFIKETSLGYFINQEALNQAQMNDDLKKLIEEQVESLNNLRNNIFDNNEAIRKEQKEFVEYQRKIRDQYLSIEDEIVKKLEEYYKQQIEDKKNMYDALSEADSDYLNALEKAINKQKELRDRQDKWNNLAEKEKKYSLLARDTSGAGQRDLLKLQQDIQKDRTGLLDESVNSVVNDLKELYDLQKETREDEIKYQESLLENSNLIQEANAIMQSWKSIDDLMSWMYEHTEGIENMSDAAIEKLSDDWKTMFDNIQVYNELQQTEISDMFNFTAQEIQQIVIGTSEALTGESSRAIQEVTNSVSQSIADAQKAVTDAMKALADAQTKYNEAIAEFNRQANVFFSEHSGSGTVGGSTTGGQGFTYSGGNSSGGGYNFTPIADSVQKAKATGEVHIMSGLRLSDVINDPKYQEVIKLGVNAGAIGIDETAHMEGTDFTEGQARWLYETLREYDYTLVEGPDGVVYAVSNDNVDNWLNRQNGYLKGHGSYKRIERKYEEGGLVNYTGPAWVDGSPAKPEAFLNAEDTARIGEAANIFKEIAALGNNGTLSSGLSSTNNNNVELHIHVDSIATEAQVDYLIDRMKQELVDAASPIGTNIIF